MHSIVIVLELIKICILTYLGQDLLRATNQEKRLPFRMFWFSGLAVSVTGIMFSVVAIVAVFAR